VPALLEPFSADLQPQLLPAGDVEALYVHVPFCFHKCHYCDFYSITRQTPERMRRYVDLVLREADRWTEDAEGPSAKPRTVFFGGGTPTLLPVALRLIRGSATRLSAHSDMKNCPRFGAKHGYKSDDLH